MKRQHLLIFTLICFFISCSEDPVASRLIVKDKNEDISKPEVMGDSSFDPGSEDAASGNVVEEETADTEEIDQEQSEEHSDYGSMEIDDAREIDRAMEDGINRNSPSQRLGISWQGSEDLSVILLSKNKTEIGTYEINVTWSESGNHNGYIDAPNQFYGIKLKAAQGSIDFLRLNFMKNKPEDQSNAPSVNTQPFSNGSSSVTGRNSWGSNGTRCVTIHKANKVTFHHTATPNWDSLSGAQRVRQIQNYHQQVLGWCDIGYHYLVDRNGTVFEGRKAAFQGAHVAGRNYGNIGISLIGDFSKAQPSQNQLNGSAKILAQVARQESIALDSSRIKSHRDYAGTECPGRYLYSKIPSIIEKARQINGQSNSASSGSNGTPVISAKWLTPSANASVSNPVTFTFNLENVDEISVKANQYTFHTMKNPSKNYRFTYKFNYEGVRYLTFVATNKSTGKTVKIDRKVTVKKSSSSNMVANWLTPSENAVVNNPVNFNFSLKDIDELTVKANQWVFHKKTNPGKNYSFSYKFNSIGLRYLTFEGKNNKTGQVIKIARKITVKAGQNGSSTNTGSVSSLGIASDWTAPKADETVLNPVKFSFKLTNIDQLKVMAENKWTFHDKVDPGSSYDFVYTFNSVGTRMITFEGRNSTTGKTITITRKIHVVTPSNNGSNNSSPSNSVSVSPGNASNTGQINLTVPYFYQGNNRYNPGSSCGATSTAMLINYNYAGKTTPDILQVNYGKAKMQTPEGITDVLRKQGLYAKYSRTGTRAQIKKHLDAGRAVIVHGFWTGAGHIAVLRGYDKKNWYANDPAGDWYVGYMNSSIQGKNVSYPLNGSFDNKMSSDGDIWFSTASTKAF